MDSNTGVPPPITPLQPTGKSVTVTPPTITDKDPTADGQDRTGQQGLLPTAVQPRFLSQIISGSNVQSSYIRVLDGRNFLVRFTLTNDSGKQVLAVPDSSVYIGITNISQVGILPTPIWPRLGFSMFQFPVSFNSSDWGFTDGINQVTSITGYNGTGNDQDVLVVTQWRVIVQPQSNDSQR